MHLSSAPIRDSDENGNQTKRTLIRHTLTTGNGGRGRRLFKSPSFPYTILIVHREQFPIILGNLFDLNSDLKLDEWPTDNARYLIFKIAKNASAL